MTIKNFCFSFPEFAPNFRRIPQLSSGVPKGPQRYAVSLDN